MGRTSTDAELSVRGEHAEGHDVKSLAGGGGRLVLDSAADGAHENVVVEGESCEGGVIEQVPVECVVVMHREYHRVEQSQLADVLLRELAEHQRLLRLTSLCRPRLHPSSPRQMW